MPSQNTGKQRKQGRSNSPDTRVKKQLTEAQKDAQRQWRVDSLHERMVNAKFTEKNAKEAERLGIQI